MAHTRRPRYLLVLVGSTRSGYDLVTPYIVSQADPNPQPHRSGDGCASNLLVGIVTCCVLLAALPVTEIRFTCLAVAHRIFAAWWTEFLSQVVGIMLCSVNRSI